jgi:hypothetical protein
VDVDRVVPGGMRVVQLTPPGSGYSIQLVAGRGEPLSGVTFFSDPDGNRWIIQERPTPE